MRKINANQSYQRSILIVYLYAYFGNVEIYWLIEEYYNYLMRIMSPKNESKYPGNVHHLRGSFVACL